MKLGTREIIESMYDCECDVFEMRTQKGMINNTKMVKTAEKQPCRISFSASPASDSSRTAADVGQKVKLFAAPEIDIKPGCYVEVFRNGIKTGYECAGECAVYENHQEISLTVKKRYA